MASNTTCKDCGQPAHHLMLRDNYGISTPITARCPVDDLCLDCASRRLDAPGRTSERHKLTIAGIAEAVARDLVRDGGVRPEHEEGAMGLALQRLQAADMLFIEKRRVAA